jgi:ubiquinone/menaquinone biosynthesis C-methylase UbiE
MLSHEQAKAFYDRFGKKQDWQGIYENAAIDALIRNGEFNRAHAVLEFGCGTGSFAERLLEEHLPTNARYVGGDISETMVALARRRLARFGGRAKVYRSDGSPRLDFGAGTFDRFVVNYVLDLLCVEEIETLLQEASRVLSADGLLGVTSLTFGFTPISRMVTRIWQALHSLRPGLVGGCRPLHLQELVTGETWRVCYADRFCSFGVPSEVLIAGKATV